MVLQISVLKILFLKSIIYENCLTDTITDCKYNDFTITGISNATLESCGSSPKNLMIGPYGFQTTVTKTFTNIPPNNQLEFSVGIWKLDSWDKEGFEVYANDILLENLILDLHEGTMICRSVIWEDKLVIVTKKFQITESQVTIKLKDNLNKDVWGEDLWDESWGFREFILRVSVPCVNFYSECNYLGTLFQICQGEQSKMQHIIPFQIKSILMGPGIIVKVKGPNYFGGLIKEFTTSDPCFDSYQVIPNLLFLSFQKLYMKNEHNINFIIYMLIFNGSVFNIKINISDKIQVSKFNQSLFEFLIQGFNIDLNKLKRKQNKILQLKYLACQSSSLDYKNQINQIK
ncbi:unnamed protein product [Paramecium sonneborni]|uniref:Uncharacterized protein n=1 Tax=Paramecium sonneborni TaxID=65129 RepID=A0A8S1QQC3_9CILI|nr:unnamed protein product [Paramecium sonneborni]